MGTIAEWDVVGADRTTGKDQVIVVKATDATGAAAVANGQGFVVAEVKPHSAGGGNRRRLPITGVIVVAVVLLVVVGAMLVSRPTQVGQTNRVAASPFPVARPGSSEEHLLIAVDSGEIEDVRSALGDEPNVNACDKYGQTALHLLAAHGVHTSPLSTGSYEANKRADNLAVLNMLLSRGADIEAKQQVGETPLMVATGSRSSAPGMLEALIAAHANVSATDDLKQTAIFNANSPEAVDVLTAAGAAVNVQDYDGQTPLHRRAGSGDDNVVTALLQHGANVNARDAKGYTPLKRAELSFRDSTISVLRAAGGTE